ncbi:phage major tail protein, TP901-1 family [Limosilactobacillus reuteri]|uniref:phage major tail protein, TP901-1 family n=1 Tax=Limosilactobacillus reuteri TaxID=1598 RepID=UPI001E351253|nr:phage major tail protein, TP901-1 family [Limosilactobacillus reuteri]MCC4331540.1 phage major tail protein, TP901-1 family [Limosilactobacillus reuteri]MCC4354771.1 phage major tail protein, TP901-1 family [Limosilactobacillus reuteri]
MADNVEAMKKSKEAIQGIDNVTFFRMLKHEKEMDAQLIPHQTSQDFTLSRDSDTTTTKDGTISTTGGLETELETEFVDAISRASDEMQTAVLNAEEVELWRVNVRRRNAEGKCFGWYMRGTVSEDGSSNDADDASTRDVTFSITGKPKRGWVTLPESIKEEIDYGFRGLAAITDEDNTGDGVAYTDDEAGTGTLTANE